MRIYIMRHGQAEHFARRDSERRLTEQGRNDNRTMANRLRNSLIELDAAFHSPYCRAEQTWDDVKALIPDVGHIEVLKGATPDGDPGRVVDHLLASAEHYNWRSLLLVSHLPLVGYIVEELDASAGVPLFTTSAIAEVEFDLSKGSGQMIQLHIPQ